MTLSPGTRLGPYELVALLGSGGMGEVYRAKDSRLGRTVAIKVLPQHVLDNPARRQRLEREARAASRLSHPHICALFDVGEHDGIHFIVMEYLEGETLAERLRRGPLPIAQVLRSATEIADALHHAHRAGVVHRDLKPANVMLTAAGVKLLDFGVARLTSSDAEADVLRTETESLTEAGTILGTLHYMAPEQLEGQEADARSDIFALGTVVYEMATARRAFEATSRASVIAAILEHDPPPLSSVRSQTATASGNERLTPPALDHVVSRCLAKDPEQRWQTAADLRQELRWIAESSSSGASAAQRAAVRRRPRVVLAWLAAACLAVAASAYLAARSGWLDEPPVQPTFKQVTFRRGLLTEARFAPDGQTIFYSAAWDGGPMQVYQTTSPGPSARPLGPPKSGLASVSASNEIALLLGCDLNYGFCVGTLARMPLSGGAPRSLLDHVVSADWTPKGEQLAAIHQTDGEYRVEFPIGKKTLHRTAGRLNTLRFSPNGDRLAFLEYPSLEDEVGSLKVVDLDGHVSELSAGWQTIHGLQWSRDGSEIWFTGSRTGKSSSLYAVSLSSGKVRVILHAPGDLMLLDIGRDGQLLVTPSPVRARMIWSGEGEERDLSWFDWSTVADLSADGKTVLFHEWGEGTSANPVVHTRRVDGSDAVRLGDGIALALSPDGGSAIALMDKGGPRLVLYSTRTSDERALPTEGARDIYRAKWFPDSRRVMAVALFKEGVRTLILDVESGKARPVADIGTMGALVHPDSRRILAYDGLGNHYIWPLDGGEPEPIAGLDEKDSPVQWGTDPRFLFLRSDDDTLRNDALRIYRFNLSTGRRELWRTLAPRDPAGVFGIATGRGEVAMTRDGRNIVFTYWAWIGDLFQVEGAR
jgi:tRNA A-37 threonylcarbamoyl transferase component Bud32/Tol biopolymer transport system component